MPLDLWDPLTGRTATSGPVLTSVEITVTNQCHLRCVHCAVGELLAPRDQARLPLAAITAALDRVETLTTLSLTGGEVSLSDELVDDWVVPLLQYAHRRGLQTQVNTHFTHDLERYLRMAPWAPLFHMTWNYRDAADFAAITRVAPAVAARLYDRIQTNAATLAGQGLFVSGETMMTPETLPHLGEFSHRLAALGCRRMEVHPRYPADFARHLPVVDLDTMRTGIEQFLSERVPGLWVLFGTFPFLPCSPDPRDRALWHQVQTAADVTVRNDPDGRSRINLDALTGDIRVSDFADLAPVGNVLAGDDLAAALAAWQDHPVFRPYNCCCPEAGCAGPNLIVAQTWLPGVDFRQRRAVVESSQAGG